MGKIAKIGVLLVCICLATLTGWFLIYLGSEGFDQRARRWFIDALEDRFAVRAEIGLVDMQIWGTLIELSNLKLFNRAHDASEPVFEVEHALLDFSISQLLFPTLSVDRVRLQNPSLRIIEDRNQKLNLTNMFFPTRPSNDRGGFSVVELGIKHLFIDGGVVLYRRRHLVIDTASGGMTTSLKFLPHEDKYLGHAQFEKLQVRVDGFGFSDALTSLDFELLENELRAVKLRVESKELDAEATGTIGGLPEFTYEFQSTLSINVESFSDSDLGAHFQEGVVQLSGTLAGTGSNFSFKGRAQSPFLRFQGLPFHHLNTELHIDRQVLSVSGLTAKLYDGAVQAEGKLRWNGRQTSQFQAAALDLHVYPLLTQLGQERLRVQGLTDLRLQLSWPGLQWREMVGNGDLAYQGTFSARGLVDEPIFEDINFEGEAELAIGNAALTLSKASLRTPHSLVHYKGQVTFRKKYRFDLELESTQTNELLQMAGHLGVPHELVNTDSLSTQGVTRFSGVLEEVDRQPRLTGSIESSGVSLNNQFLGDFESALSLTDTVLQLDRTRLAGRDFELRASAKLALNSKEEASDLLNLQFERVPVRHLLAAAGLRMHMEGRISGELQLERNRPHPVRGSGKISMIRPQAFGQRLDRLNTRIDIVGDRVLFQEAHGYLNEGIFSGDAMLDLNQKTYSVSLQGRQFPLGQIQGFEKRVGLSDRVNFTLEGKGEVGAPQFELSALTPTMEIYGYKLEKVDLTATIRGTAAEFRLNNTLFGNPQRWEGELSLVEPYMLISKVDVNRFPLIPTLKLIRFQETASVDGFFTGTLLLSGPLDDPEKLIVEATVPEMRLLLGGYQLQTNDPLSLSYRGQILTLNRFALSGSDTEIDIKGTIDLSQRPNLNLEMRGAVNLLAVNSLLPKGTTAGELDLQMNILGPLDDPQIVGSAQLKQGLLVHPDLPATLFDARGNFRFTANQVSLEAFSTRTVFGDLEMTGGIFLQGFKPTRWQINALGTGLQLEYPDKVFSTLDVDLDFLKSKVSEIISGAVYIRSVDYARDISLSDLIFQYVQSETIPLNPHIQNIGLEVTVEAYQSLRVSNNLADAVGSADLAVRGTWQNPIVLGTITIDEGTLLLENNTYDISRGSINFNNPRRTRPILNFEAETDVRDFTVAVLVNGPIDQLKVSFRSNPPLPTSSIVSLLAVGQTQEEIFGSAGQAPDQVGALAVYGAGAVLSKSIGEKLEARTSRLFGFEKFSIDPFLFGSERDPGARLTLGKRLTEDVVRQLQHGSRQ